MNLSDDSLQLVFKRGVITKKSEPLFLAMYLYRIFRFIHYLSIGVFVKFKYFIPTHCQTIYFVGVQRERYFYDSYVDSQSSREIICSHSFAVPKINRIFLLFKICIKYDFIHPKKVLQIIDLDQELKGLHFPNRIEKFVAHDGAGFVHRYLALFFGQNSIRTISLWGYEVEVDYDIFDESVIFCPLVKNNELSRINSVFIGAPESYRIFGIEYWLFFYLLGRKFSGRKFCIKLHPQCLTYQEMLLRLFFGSRFYISKHSRLEDYKVKCLYSTYFSSLSNMQNLMYFFLLSRGCMSKKRSKVTLFE